MKFNRLEIALRSGALRFGKMPEKSPRKHLAHAVG